MYIQRILKIQLSTKEKGPDLENAENQEFKKSANPDLENSEKLVFEKYANLDLENSEKLVFKKIRKTLFIEI